MADLNDSAEFQSGREDSNLRPLDPQSSDSSLSVRNCILPPPLETGAIGHSLAAIGSQIQTRAEFKIAHREERLTRRFPWRLSGYRFDPATSGAWAKETCDLIETATQRLRAELEHRAFGPEEHDTDPAPALGLVGQKFGKLTVVEEVPGRNNGSICVCDCDCGSVGRRVVASKLRKKSVRSCGCLRRNGKAAA